MSYISIDEAQNLKDTIVKYMREERYNKVVFYLDLLLDTSNDYSSEAAWDVYSFVERFCGYISQTKKYVGHTSELIEIIEKFCDNDHYDFRSQHTMLLAIVGTMHKNFKNDDKSKKYFNQAIECIDREIKRNKTYPVPYYTKIRILGLLGGKWDEICELVEKLKMVCEIEGDYTYYNWGKEYTENKYARYNLSSSMP